MSINVYKTAVDEAREALAQAEVLIDSAIETIESLDHDTPEPAAPVIEPIVPDPSVSSVTLAVEGTPVVESAPVPEPVAPALIPAEAPAPAAVLGDVLTEAQPATAAAPDAAVAVVADVPPAV